MTATGTSSVNPSSVMHSRDSTSTKILKESGGFMVAEVASAATGLGVVAIADWLIPPPIMKYASKAIAKVVVEPCLDGIERTLSAFCKLKECQPDPDMPREERAERIAKTMIVFGAAYAASMLVKLGTRRAMNEAAGIIEHVPASLPAGATMWEKFKYFGGLQFMAPEEKLIFALDEGVHLGSLYLLNNQMAPFTDDMIRRTTNMIHKTTGMDEKKSHEIANMAWIWEAANGLGAAAAAVAITGNHTAGWATKGWLGKILANKLPPESLTHVEKLAAKSVAGAITTPIPHA